MALVIKHWYASNTPDSQGNYVHLVGREEGILAWILSSMGLDPTTHVKITCAHIIFVQASLAGTNTRVIPMRHVTQASYGYQKPWQEALLIGLICLPLLGLGLLLGPLWYFLNKTLSIGVVESSGWTGSFAFKRSVIHGQNIDEQSAYQTLEIVRGLIDRFSAGQTTTDHLPVAAWQTRHLATQDSQASNIWASPTSPSPTHFQSASTPSGSEGFPSGTQNAARHKDEPTPPWTGPHDLTSPPRSPQRFCGMCGGNLAHDARSCPSCATPIR